MQNLILYVKINLKTSIPFPTLETENAKPESSTSYYLFNCYWSYFVFNKMIKIAQNCCFACYFWYVADSRVDRNLYTYNGNADWRTERCWPLKKGSFRSLYIHRQVYINSVRGSAILGEGGLAHVENYLSDAHED